MSCPMKFTQRQNRFFFLTNELGFLFPAFSEESTKGSMVVQTISELQKVCH